MIMDEVSKLKHVFYLKSSEWELEILADGIKWTLRNGDIEEQTKVHITDLQLLHCELSKTNASENKSTLSLGYINKRPDGKWIYDLVTFTGDLLSDDVISWQQELCRVLQSGKAKRPKRLLVLINPNAGKGNAVALFNSKAAPLFSIAGIDTDVKATKSSDHIGEIIAAYDFQNIDGIICAGGDGTVSKTCNYYYRRYALEQNVDISTADCQLPTSPIPIGILPTGSGQFLAQRTQLGLMDLETAALRIVTGETFRQSAISVHALAPKPALLGLSLLAVSVGLTAEWCRWSEDLRYLGQFRFLVAALKLLWRWRSADIEYQHKKGEGDEWSAPETQTTCLFSAFTVADITSGRADVTTVEHLPCMRALFVDNDFSRRSLFSSKAALMGNLEQVRLTPGMHTLDALQMKLRYKGCGSDLSGDDLALDGEACTPGASQIHLRYHPHVFTLFGDSSSQQHPFTHPV